MCRSSTSSSDDDGLVAAPPDLVDAGWRRVAAWMVVAGFLTLTGGAGVLDAVAPARGPQLTSIDRAARRVERATADIASGARMRVIDRDLQEHSNVRFLLTPWYLAHVLLPLREGGSGVVVGRDGWLFLESRITPRDGAHHPDHAALAANTLTAIDRRLLALGLDPVLVPVPRKGTVATRFLPDGADLRPGFEQALTRRLREGGIPFVDVAHLWRDVDPALTWLRHDTHWSSYGRWLAMEQAVRQLGRLVDPALRSSPAEHDVTAPVPRELLKTLGIPLEHPVFDTIPHDSLPGPLVTDEDIAGLSTADPPLVVIGTSFTAHDDVTREVSHLVDGLALNLGRQGEHLGRTLHDALRDGLPEGADVIVEVPTFQLQLQGFRGRGLHRHKESMLEPLTLTDPPAWHPLDVELLTPSRDVWTLPARLLGTSGDGVVSIVLSGRPEGARRLTAVLATDGTRLAVEWPEDRDSVSLPIITPSPGSEFLRVTLEGARPGHDVRVRVATELDLENATPLPGARAVGDGGRWHDDRSLPPGALAGRHVSVWVELPERGAGVDPRIELLGPGGARHLVSDVPLRLDGTALMRVAAPPGAWSTLRLSGAGPRPVRPITVRLVDVPAR